MAAPKALQTDVNQFASQVLHHGRKQGTNDHTLRFSGRADDTEGTAQSDNSVSPGWNGDR